MSDFEAALTRIESAVQRLTLAVDLLSLRVSQIESTQQNSDTWELVEPEQLFVGGLSSRQVVLEDGPPPIPTALAAYASVLSDIAGGREARARAAYEAGFWAQIALETHTEYHPTTNRDLTFSHWIVLRGAGVTSPFRVTRRSDLSRLVTRPPTSQASGGVRESPIIQGFASLAELRIFCGGAALSVPPLLRWRSN